MKAPASADRTHRKVAVIEKDTGGEARTLQEKAEKGTRQPKSNIEDELNRICS